MAYSDISMCWNMWLLGWVTTIDIDPMILSYRTRLEPSKTLALRPSDLFSWHYILIWKPVWLKKSIKILGKKSLWQELCDNSTFFLRILPFWLEWPDYNVI